MRQTDRQTDVIIGAGAILECIIDCVTLATMLEDPDKGQSETVVRSPSSKPLLLKGLGSPATSLAILECIIDLTS